MNIYLLQYNNYYNRIVKKYDTIDEYIKNVSVYDTKGNINFNPNDNITTELTINWTNTWAPDYLLALNTVDNSFTRWFVMDSFRLRGNQYKLRLRHDVVADNLEDILESDCFIEKAIVPDENPLIFNKESSTVNQIKTNEWKIKDATGCPWICMYYDKSYLNKQDTEDITMTFRTYSEFDYTITTSFEDWKNENGNDTGYFDSLILTTNLDPELNWRKDVAIYDQRLYSIFFFKNNSTAYNVWSFPGAETNSIFGQTQTILGNDLSNIDTPYPSVSRYNAKNSSYGKLPDTKTVVDLFINRKNQIINSIGNNVLGNFRSYEDFLDLLKYNNKIIRFIPTIGSEEYYRVNISIDESLYDIINCTYKNKDNIWTELYKNTGFDAFSYSDEIIGAGSAQRQCVFYYKLLYNKIKITAEPIRNVGTYSAKLSKGKYQTEDSVFGLCCMPYPYNDETKILINSLNINGQISLQTATSFTEQNPGVIKDVQILPFCPIVLNQVNNQSFTVDDLYEYDTITFVPDTPEGDDPGTPTVAGYILYPRKVSFTLKIPFNEYQLTNKKMSNETDILRLVSPNYAGQFEFSPAKNNGISFFEVDCTYQPQTPYIHINPNFGLLYGDRDYNDARGLICGGDFSLPMITDQWETYQMNNKNYLNTFNREISNMEVQHDVSRFKDIYNIATSGIKGAVAGAAVSGGNPVVAGVNAIGNMAEAGMNLALNEKLRDEALDYKRDMFGFQLGNIKAMPQSISKVSPFSYNNKYFPIVEYYTCTEIEKEAIANKIAYNGMTVMTIGKLKDYVNNLWSYKNITSKRYIKGQLIRLENFSDDYHILNEIGNELNKGVYYEGN